MIITFDLDGVMIDSEELVARGYRAAGVEPPRPVLAQEGTGWLVGRVGLRSYERVRSTKNFIYLSGIRGGRVPLLPACETALTLWSLGHELHLLTGAPAGTAAAFHRMWLTRFSRFWPFSLIIDEMKTPDKMRFMRGQDRPGVYVDDQNKFINLPPDWRFVHHVDKTMRAAHLSTRILRAVREIK